MNKKMAVIFVGLLLISMVFIGGCAAPSEDTKPKTNAEASETLSDMGSDIKGISDTLDDIDKNFGQ